MQILSLKNILKNPKEKVKEALTVVKEPEFKEL
jgi:hypothetical protein